MVIKKSIFNKSTISTPVFWLIAGGGFLILLDQTSKHLVFTKFPDTTFCNHGIAYGIILPPIIFALIWWVSVLFLTYGLYRAIQHKLSLRLIIPQLALISGAISNGIDRLLRGCVLDFIPVNFFEKFNLADVFIVSGAIFFALNLIALRNKVKTN